MKEPPTWIYPIQSRYLNDRERRTEIRIRIALLGLPIYIGSLVASRWLSTPFIAISSALLYLGAWSLGPILLQRYVNSRTAKQGWPKIARP
jgi:hypothetical protein